jgi:hypothetical protein
MKFSLYFGRLFLGLTVFGFLVVTVNAIFIRFNIPRILPIETSEALARACDQCVMIAMFLYAIHYSTKEIIKKIEEKFPAAKPTEKKQ